MKKHIILLLLITQCLQTLGQNTEVATPNKLQLEIGYTFLSNSLNGDNYYRFLYAQAPNTKETTMSGVNIKFTLPTKNKSIDFIFGSMFLLGNDELGTTSWTSQQTNAYDYILNGGGVYAGISPKVKKKNWGVTSDFAIGLFSFKEYLAIYNNLQNPIIKEYEKKASYGLGATTSVGVYFNFGKLGINPTLNAVYSGSSSASFLFYGFTLPLTFQF